MTSQGTAHGRFQRVIQRGQRFHAELAGRELGQLHLADALSLAALFAGEDPVRYERAAVRWHGRLELEAKRLSLPRPGSRSPRLRRYLVTRKPLARSLARIGERAGIAAFR